MRTAVRHRVTVQSHSTNVEFVYCNQEMLMWSRIFAEFIRHGAEANKGLSAAENCKRMKPMSDVQQHLTTVCKSLPHLCLWLPLVGKSGVLEICGPFFQSAWRNVRSQRQAMKDYLTEELGLFAKIFQTLESELANKLRNVKVKLNG